MVRFWRRFGLFWFHFVDILAPFVEHILEFSTASAAVMIPFLHLLRSMSKSENGKLIVLDVMKGDIRMGTVNWDLLFATLSEYCVRYSKPISEVAADHRRPLLSPLAAALQSDVSAWLLWPQPLPVCCTSS